MTSFKCPKCKRVSYNVNDVIHRYCGACKAFFEVHDKGPECWCQPQKIDLDNGETMIVHRYPEEAH